MFDLFLKMTRTALGITVLALAIVLSACGPTVVHTEYNNVPVLVAGEDEDKTTVKRSSDIFKRVLAELKHDMKRTGFRMVDEESVSVDNCGRDAGCPAPPAQIRTCPLRHPAPPLGCAPTSADGKSLVGPRVSDSQLGPVRSRVHAVVQVGQTAFRIHAAAKDLRGLTKVRTHIDESYAVKANEFIDTFEMPRQESAAPQDCLQDKLCITEVVGTTPVAGSLGVVLARKFARYRDVSASGARAGGSGGAERPVTGTGRMAQGDSGHGMQTPYTVMLRYFERREALTIIGVMADEFPGYKSHTLLSADPAVRKYEYVTSAKPNKMEKWLTILLTDMNFDPDEVTILIRGQRITVEKIVPTPDRPKSGNERRSSSRTAETPPAGSESSAIPTRPGEFAAYFFRTSGH